MLWPGGDRMPRREQPRTVVLAVQACMRPERRENGAQRGASTGCLRAAARRGLGRVVPWTDWIVHDRGSSGLRSIVACQEEQASVFCIKPAEDQVVIKLIKNHMAVIVMK